MTSTASTATNPQPPAGRPASATSSTPGENPNPPRLVARGARVARLAAVVIGIVCAVATSVTIGIATYLLNHRVDEAAAVAMGLANSLSTLMLQVSAVDRLIQYRERRSGGDNA